MSLNLRNFTQAVYTFDAVVHRVADEDWDNQSPCEEWAARDVLKHQCGVLGAMTATLVSGKTVAPSSIESADNPAVVWQQTRDALLEALDTPGILDREGKFWFGPMSVDQWIQMVQWDPITHAWDIAKAADIDAHIPDGLAEISYEVMGPMRETLAGWGLIADQVELLEGAGATERFLAMVGRDPS